MIANQDTNAHFEVSAVGEREEILEFLKLTPTEKFRLLVHAIEFLPTVVDDDLPLEGIAKAAHAGEAFDFLSDSREDICSGSDGEAV